MTMNINFKPILKNSSFTRKDLVNSFSKFIEESNYYEALKIMAFDWKYEIISKKDRRKILNFLEENYDVENMMSRYKKKQGDYDPDEIYNIAKFSTLEEDDEFELDKSIPPIISLVYNTLPKKFSDNSEYFYRGIQEIHPDIIPLENLISVISEAITFENKKGSDSTGCLRWIIFRKFEEYTYHFEARNKESIDREQFKSVINFCMQDHSILNDASIFTTLSRHFDLLCDFISKNYDSIPANNLEALFSLAFAWNNKDIISCMIKKGYKRFSKSIHEMTESDIISWSESDFRNEILSLIIKSSPKKFSDKLIYQISSMMKNVQNLLKTNPDSRIQKKGAEFLSLLNQMCGGNGRIILKP